MSGYNLYIDFDGCLGTINTFYSKAGKTLKSVSASDSLVIDVLQKSGIVNNVTVITGDSTGFVITKARIFDLGYELVYCKNKNKYNYILEKEDTFDNVIYIGDDIYDVLIFDKVKYSGAPSSAIPFVKEYANYISECPGGKGAVSDLLIKITNDILKDTDKSFIDLVHEQAKG